MKSSQIIQTLAALYEARQPAFIWGSPGIGKSDVMRQATMKLGIELIDVRAILLDPVDLRGIPSLINGTTKWNVPDFLPKKGYGILFLDELNAAPPSIQAACYQLILDRKLGDYTLPDGWVVFAAGNMDTDRAVTNRMSTALSNRFIHLNFEINLDDWVQWALKNNVKTEVISFIRFRPTLLHAFNPQSGDKAFPTPRSWEFVSRILTQGIPKDLEYEIISGTIGEGAASEFIGFIRIFRELPNPDVILMTPERVDVPTDPAVLYALCGALTAKASDQNMDRIVQFANRLPDEFSVLLIRDIIVKDDALANTRAFIEWAAKHKEVMI